MYLIAVGRIREGPEAALFQIYNSRLRPRLTVTEVPTARGDASAVKRKECASLLAALPKGAFIIPLDQGGHALNSEEFSALLSQWSCLARPICFLIGGAEGLDTTVVRKADYVLSLGAMTWPHFMVRAMLAEQLYRSQAIAQHHPYHRSGRPEPAAGGR
jgi:23S rRNA (pseudouridine1915-N3)-methyltransferase